MLSIKKTTNNRKKTEPADKQIRNNAQNFIKKAVPPAGGTAEKAGGNAPPARCQRTHDRGLRDTMW